MIKAAIFDMDGLLVDSEPLWTKAEIEVFASVGIDLDERACGETVGMGLPEVVATRYGKQPWHGKSQQDVERQILDRVIELVSTEARPMPGALAAVALARRKGAKIAVASSSARPLIEAALKRLDLSGAFDHVQSAADLDHIKPHPEVYLVTAAKLGVDPLHCLAFEDSLPGLIATKAAQMTAVAVPEPRHAGDPRYSIADLVLESLGRLDEAQWDQLC